ncbi:MAG TPA: efflux RND transporter periplasmic adaptor subunit [Ignavibacteria bacterium]|nr:efflux RND transporter periplasmic adaptor subunit [Ignavibacteria bacterium]
MNLIKYMKIMPMIFLKIFLLLFILSGCGGNDATKEAHDEHGHEEGEHKEEVVLTDEQMKIMNIQLEKLQTQNLSGYIKVNGEIAANQDAQSRVGSLISGRVNKIYVKEGSYVRAGQTLAVIENPQLIDMQVDYINAKNEYEFTKQEYERQLKLNQNNIGSQKTLADLEANYKRALANYRTLEEKLASYKISTKRFDNIYSDTTAANLQRFYSVTSPISGNVVSRMVTVGQFVEPSVDMFYIINTSTVYADLSVFEKDLPFITEGQKVTITPNNTPNEIFEGKISYISRVFDDKNRTVKVRVAINNRQDKLLPFMFITAKIYVSANSVLAVPLSALETEGEEKFVFFKTNEMKEIESHPEHSEDEHKHDEGEHKHEEDEQKEGEEHAMDEQHPHEQGIVFKKVMVNTGISDDKYIEIFPIEELNPGTEIVTSGTFYLKAELKKEELSGHEH